MRLIDADALIDDIKNHLWDWETVNGITAKTVLKQTITDIENQPTASPWHRVEDGLPPVGEVVWCYFSGSKLYEALELLLVTKEGDLVWQDGTHCFNFTNGVTHWMPIEPPKEDA